MTTATAAPYYVGGVMYAVRGDGHFAGTPMVCLTLDPAEDPAPPGVHAMPAREVAEECLLTLSHKFRRCGHAHDEPYPARGAWVYIGGQGARTAELHALIDALQDLGFYVALETGPEATNHVGAGIDWVCVACNMPGMDPDDANAEAIGHADELRFLITKPSDIDFALAFSSAHPPTQEQARTISVQPVGEDNVTAKSGCIRAALAFGWRVTFMPHPGFRPQLLTLDDVSPALAAELAKQRRAP